jgi:serine phosphatase RsbU (regulator of sigma subunit)/pSer/pThr/pTyr-binding forkhead associated (FHA) protein
VPLRRLPFVIGRRTTADLQVSNTDVSREHAEINLDGDAYVLRDKQSRFGTYVNGEPVSERRLLHGDAIRLGHRDGVEMVFLSDEEESGLGRSSSELNDFAQMAAVLDGLRALGSGRVLDEVLTLVLDSAIEATRADRGFVMLADAQGALEFKIARGRGKMTLPGTTFATSEKIPREVFATGKSRIVGDLLDGSFANEHGGTIAVGIRHVVCVPLQVTAFGAAAGRGNRVIGVLYLDGRERSTMLSPATRGTLEAFATQAALAIESARLYAESAEKARIDRDLRIAAEIQQALLPEPNYDGPSCDVAAASVPCRTVGGDFYDYLEVDEGQFGFALGDVAGKGPPAAILAAVVQSNFAAQAPIGRDPAQTMGRINTALLRRAIEARFATMSYCVLGSDGSLRSCNAGQEPPLVIGADGVQWLETGGPVLGLLDGIGYEFETVRLQKGDVVVVCSDGVTEARDVNGEEFGRGRLLEAVATCHDQQADVVLERLLAAVSRFSAGAPQADDITVLALRYHGGAA